MDMNWSAVSALVSVITLIGVVGVGGMMWGTMSEKVAGIIRGFDDQKEEIAQIDGRLNGHDIQLGRLEEWKNGYNAAARVSGRTPDLTETR